MNGLSMMFLADYIGTDGVMCLALLIIAACAYFLGCFNGAVIVSKYVLRDDVRSHGSGNAGLTNFHRTFGGALTAVVILCDMLKAVLALLIAVLVSQSVHIGISASADSTAVINALPAVMAKYWAALFCLLGHMFPCMFQFKGGKGILSGGTIALMIDWRVALVVWGGFFILVILTRYVSLGSVWAGASFPFISWFVVRHMYTPHRVFIVMLAFVTGGLVVWQHRGNIKRLLTGTESKFSFHKKQ